MSGALTQFGVAPETTYGVAVAPSTWFEIVKESFSGSDRRAHV